MAYYFAVETEENSFNAINVKRCRYYFNTTNNYTEPLACTLKEINDVTTTFANEEELKKMLLSVYSLKEEDYHKPLAIFYLDGMERRLVKGNILYEDSRNFLEEPNKVIEYIREICKNNDYTFFRKLSEMYPNDSICKSLICKIASILEGKTINENENISIESLVTEVTKILINNTEINQNGMITYKNTVNYEKLHVLVSFITDYELSLKNNLNNQKRKIKENTSK